MPSFSCPKCKKVLKSAAPIPAGKKIKCPACTHVFAMPAAEEETGIKANKPLPPPRQPAAVSPKATARTKERPQERDDEDEEAEDRPVRKKKKKKKKVAGNNGLLIGLSAGGGLLLILAIAAFLWPGFLLSSNTKALTKGSPRLAKQPQAAAPVDPLSFVPNNCDYIAGMNMTDLQKQGGFKNIEPLLKATVGLKGPADVNLYQNLDQIILSGNLPDKGAAIVYTSLTPLEPEKVRRVFNLNPPDNLQGKMIYKSAPGGPAKILLAMPDDKTLVLTNSLIVFNEMPEGEFLKIIAGNGKLPPDMHTQVSAISQKTVWAVVNLQSIPKDKMQALDQLLQVPGGAEILPTLKSAKWASFSMGQAQGASLQLDLTCANDKDANQVESFVKNLWEKEGKPKLLTLADLPGAEALRPVVTEISQNLRIQTQGAVVSASLTISENTLKAMEKLQAGDANSPPQKKNAKKK